MTITELGQLFAVAHLCASHPAEPDGIFFTALGRLRPAIAPLVQSGHNICHALIHPCLLLVRGTHEQLNRMAGLSRSAKTFAPKQGQYLAFIHLYTRLHRRPPAETDMQEYFRVSPPSVHQMVLTLERAGFIGRQPRTARNIEVLVDPVHLPELL